MILNLIYKVLYFDCFYIMDKKELENKTKEEIV